MGYKLNASDENQLWRNYMDEHRQEHRHDVYVEMKLPFKTTTTTNYSEDEFLEKLKTDDDFANRFGCKIVIKELSLEERYHIWFTNNYETGMERYFDPNNIPNFDDAYYEPTPTKLKTITYKEQTIKSYE